MKYLLLIFLGGQSPTWPTVIGPFEFVDLDSCSRAKEAVAAVMHDGTVLCAQVLSEITRGPVKK